MSRKCLYPWLKKRPPSLGSHFPCGILTSMVQILTEPSSPATASSAVSSWPVRHASCRMGFASSSLPNPGLADVIEGLGDM